MNLPMVMIAGLCSTLLLGCTTTRSEPEPEPEYESVQAEPRNTEYPWMSLERWYHMHAEDVGVAAKVEAQLLFVGDSITEGWPEELMNRRFGNYQPANFGIGGDRTENLLWRLRNGSVGQLQPKVISLLIGINNLGLRGDSPEEVIAGIEAVVGELQQAFPESHIVLHGIFPYKQAADSPERAAVKQVNGAIAQLANTERITYLDVGPQFLQSNGALSADIMPDYLHLSAQGYQLWASALAPVVERLMEPGR